MKEGWNGRSNEAELESGSWGTWEYRGHHAPLWLKCLSMGGKYPKMGCFGGGSKRFREGLEVKTMRPGGETWRECGPCDWSRVVKRAGDGIQTGVGEGR